MSMNRQILIFLFLAISSPLVAQQATLALKDGQSVRTIIKAVSESAVFTSAGNYEFTRINRVTFAAKSTADATVYARLEKAGIAIAFDNAQLPREELPASPGKYLNFYLTNDELYWERTFPVTISRDSLRSTLRLFMASTPEIVRYVEVNKDVFNLAVDNWFLHQGDGKYPARYRSGRWSLSARITLESGLYKVSCKAIRCKGVYRSTFFFFAGKIRETVATLKELVTIDQEFIPARQRHATLVDKNLSRFFQMAGSTEF